MTNLEAFLAMIRHSEGTDRAPDPYRVVFGFSVTLADLSDHPALTGEWLGVQTQYGYTTAAGAYQIIKPTWIALKSRLHLPDFSATSQDAAAIELIREKGALDLVNGGQVANAIQLCHGIWASLPGSTSGQPQAKMADLIQAYSNSGGAFA